MLAPADCAVDDDIRRAETLPAAAFTDPDFLAAELATVFARAWLLVPEPGDGVDPGASLAERLAARGARVPVTLLGRPLFVQRGWDDDRLRCFPNTCTHAWYPLVAGPGRGPTLQCGQHGRRFDCTGRMIGHAGFGDALDFPRPCDHLTELPAAVWRDLVFTRLATGPGGPDPEPARPARPALPSLPSLHDQLADVDASLTGLPERLAPAPTAGAARDVSGNWKLHAWNFLDHFHVGFVHRAPGGLADAVDLASYTTELYDHAVLQWVHARDPADGFDPALLPERFRDAGGRRVFALWWFVWPNLTLNYYPWGLSVNVYQPVPGRPDTTRFLWYQRVLDPELHAERDRRWLSAQVDAEDVDALARVRAGLRSGHAPRGRFAPGAEQAAHWFHRKVARAVFPP